MVLTTPLSPPRTFSSLPAHTSFMTHFTFLWVTAWYRGVKDVLYVFTFSLPCVATASSEAEDAPHRSGGCTAQTSRV